MHSLVTRPAERAARLWAAPAAALLTASVLVASVAPSVAAGENLVHQAAHSQERSVFHRHFYRGVPYSPSASSAVTNDVTTVATDEDAMAQAMAYCAGRFKSFDPSTGTYLGYDGYEHACP